MTNGAMREGINPRTLHRCFNPKPHAGTDAQPSGRLSFVVPFAPLTAAAILITGVLWTRWLQPSAVESIVALIGIELFTWGVVRFFAGEWWSFFVLRSGVFPV